MLYIHKYPLYRYPLRTDGFLHTQFTIVNHLAIINTQTILYLTHDYSNGTVTDVDPMGQVGPGLHFITKKEKNKTSKFAIKIEGDGVDSTIGSPKSHRA